MKKRAFIVLFVLLLTAFSSVSVFAATSNVQRIIDNAGLLSSGEKTEIEQLLKDAGNKLGMDVVIITANNIPDSYSGFGDDASEKYADDLYDNGGYAADGILLFISAGGGEGNRDYAISTTGKGIEVFTDAKLDGIVDDILPYLRESDYGGAFKEFAKSAGSVKDFKFGLWGAIAAGLGAIVGAIRSGSLKSQLKSVYNKTEAADYIKSGSFVLNSKFDIPTYRTFTRTQISDSSRSGSQSSTHVSSSGTTHGGTHGKF